MVRSKRTVLTRLSLHRLSSLYRLAFLLVLLPALASTSFSQETGYFIEDENLSARIKRTLEENDMLRGSYMPGAHDRESYAVTMLGNSANRKLSHFFIFSDDKGKNIDPVAGEERIGWMLGQDIVEKLKSLQFTYEKVNPDKIENYLWVRAHREEIWWTSKDLEISTEGVHARLNRDLGVTIAQGDYMLGLPLHTAGFTRIGIGSKHFRAGVQVPFASRILASSERKVSGGIGGFGSFAMYEGSIGGGGTGYFQAFDDPDMVNYRDENLIFGSKWGGVAYMDFFVDIGSSGRTLQFIVGGGAYNMRRMRKEGDRLTDPPVVLHSVPSATPAAAPPGDNTLRVTPGTDTEVTRALILFLMNYRSSMKEGYARFETTLGYAGNGIYASATYFISGFIGLNFQYIYYPDPEDWQGRSLFFFSPVLRFNLY